MPISRERFFLGHSMTRNKVPRVVKLKRLAKIPHGDIDLKHLGLFDISAPDFNKFYPDLKIEDLNPKDNEFAYPVFRALSEIIINKYGPIDFTNGVLKPSLKKIIGQSVFTNHEAMVGNEVGVVLDCFWDEARKQGKITIPAGINVRFKLDGKSNPKLVRNINMDPPSVHSVSVTVAFKWEKSHPELSDEQFWSQVGAYDAKGKLIRRVVTEVFSYEEISLVSHGADPYAQKINEKGGITNPAYADNKYQFSADDFVENGHYFDWKEFSTSKIRLSRKDTIPDQSKMNDNKSSKKNNLPLTEGFMNKNTLKLLREKFNMPDATEEAIIAKLNETLPGILEAQTELVTTKAALAALTVKYPEGSVIMTAEDKAKLADATATADKATTALRAEALRLYHLTVGGADKAEAAITKMISEASYDTATALHKQYTTLTEKSFSAKCDDCGSTKVTRASASAAAPGVITHEQEEHEEKKVEVKTNAQLMAEFQKADNKASSIHGETKKK